MTTYLLNSAVLTSFGCYRYEPISVDAAAERLASADFISAIGHQPTAELMSNLLGVAVDCQRIQITMQPNDDAIVFRLKQRLADYTELTAEQLMDLDFELGLLTRFKESEDT